MIRRTLLYLLLCVGSGILIIGCSQEQDQTPSERMEKAGETVQGNKPEPYTTPEASLPDSPAPVKPQELVGVVRLPGALTKQERINDLYDSLTEADRTECDRWGRHPKEIEILAEGMDTFTAAKYFRSHGGYGYIDYANEYAKRAVAENPGNFEMLLFYAQTLGLDQMDEQEATYRQLYEMAPDSVEVLYELGDLLSMRKPDEAVVYLEKLLAIDPSNSWAYGSLGVSYRELGRWDEAVKAFQKQIEINPQIKWMTDGAIELVNRLKKEAAARNSVDIKTEDTPPEK